MSATRLSLEGRTGLVTGASRGIGAGIARAYAAAGANLVLVGRSGSALDRVAQEVSETGVSARCIAADLSRREDVDRVVAEAGAVDILVNNASVEQRYLRCTRWPEDYWRKAFEVGFWAAALLMRELGRDMAERGRGVVLNISSTAGQRAVPFLGHYCAFKAALDMLTRVSAIELAPAGVRVMSIAPGGIDTGHHGLADASALRAPIGRIGQPQDVASLAAYLASDEAAFLSGHVFFCDGALSAGEFTRNPPPFLARVE
ncbi:MAG TPA: SDR family oxidoreductase [Ramlibacter sp.]|nr:SDR family oxidoreductase [Ramlibacter sp.]